MDDQVLQNLLRVAHQCEIPSPDAVEHFIDEFHRRQARLSMNPSFFEKIQAQFENIFTHFHIPTLAYASATAIAVFLSVLILRAPRLNHQQEINPLVSEELEAPLNYVSSPTFQDRIEPVTFEVKKKSDKTGDVVSPLSFTLKRRAACSSAKTF